jgi:AbrB family transcriptional regulator (stage V sporulation protein T)
MGRIIVPKEVRKALNIKDGDPFEIFIDNANTCAITFKKYSEIEELGSFTQQYAHALFKTTGHTALICDTNKIVASAGTASKDYFNKYSNYYYYTKNDRKYPDNLISFSNSFCHIYLF